MSSRRLAIDYADPIFLTDAMGSSWGIPRLQGERPLAIDITGDGVMEIIFSTTPEGRNERPVEANPLVVYAFRDGRLVDITQEVMPGPVGGSIMRNFITGDFTGNGLTDLFLNNTGTEAFWPFPGERNQLLLNDGQGGFINGTAALPNLTDFSHGAVVADFNGDGHLDIFVNNLADDELIPSYLLLGDGQGGFSAPHFTHSAPGFTRSSLFSADFENFTSSYHAEFIDYNGNGIPDIYMGFVTYLGDPADAPSHAQFAVALNDGHGNFTLHFDDALAPNLPAHLWRSGDIAAEFTQTGDLNGNGLLDLVVYWDGPDTDVFYLQILENRGAAGYVDVSVRIEGQEHGIGLPSIAGTPFFHLVDFDGDGDLDILITRWNSDFTGQVTLLFENDGNGNFTRLDTTDFPGSVLSIIADVNGDGIPDLIYGSLGWEFDWELDLDAYEHYPVVQLGMPATPEGANQINGGNGNNTLNGTNGADVIRTGGGNNFVDAGAGADRIFTGDGNDTVWAGNGFDFIDARAGGRNFLHGGAGNDTIWGGNHGDTINGGTGDDVIIAGSGDDLLIGGGGNNLIRAGSGNDTIIAGAGDTVYGGAGRDRLILESGGPAALHITVTAHNGPSVDGFITFANGARLYFHEIEELPSLPTRPGSAPDGLPGSDPRSITGTMSHDTLIGGDGDDLLNALAGDDLIFATGGNNVIWGGRGDDTIWGADGNDTVGGGLGDDVIHGVGGNNMLWGSEGNDTVYGGTGNDTIGGGSGNDLIYGGRGQNQLWGGRGNDTIYAGDGGDSLGGNAGDDVLIGGAGNDTLYAGAGSDTLYGGGGNDVFVFFRQYDHNRIMDFGAGDRLELAQGLWRGQSLSVQQVIERFAHVNAAGNIVLDFAEASTVIELEGFSNLGALGGQINII